MIKDTNCRITITLSKLVCEKLNTLCVVRKKGLSKVITDIVNEYVAVKCCDSTDEIERIIFGIDD